MSTPGASVTPAPLAVETRGLNKWFGPVHANRDIALQVRRGTIHGIIGENGAGKSTLMNLLYGYYHADSGEIRINGETVRLHSPQDAIRRGIGMVHQHFMLVEPFSVLENVMLGAEGGATLRESIVRIRAELQRLAREYRLEVDPDAPIAALPVGVQQRVEILKALYRGAEILILDEPTGVLTPQEADHLFRILDLLRGQGKTVLLITHKLREVMAITDQVTVMRQGQVVASRDTARTRREELAELMVGRKVALKVSKTPARPGAPVLEVEGLRVHDHAGTERVKGVDLSVRAGEIVGIAGVAGNGQSELLEALSGIRPVSGGRVRLAGVEMIAPGRRSDPLALKRAGVAHVPEDRQRMGMVMSFSAADNAILGYHREPTYNGRVLRSASRIRQLCQDYMERYDVRPRLPGLKAQGFSGGNQQKLVIAREIEHDPKLLLVGQPTRGVDIGAIEFIHKQLIALRDAGKAILLVSVELEEILALADRILVMFDGHIVGAADPASATERELGLMMAGCRPEEAAA